MADLLRRRPRSAQSGRGSVARSGAALPVRPGSWWFLLAAFLLVQWLCASVAQPSNERGATRVVVMSDFNESYGSVRYSPHVDAAVERTIALAPDLVISTGDMVAGQRLAPPLGRAEIEAMWQSFHERVSTPLAGAGLPFAVTPGNHDASGGKRFQLERDIYRQQWQDRKPGITFVDHGTYPFRYAFRVGDVLFASLDATYVGHLSRIEKDWLRDLLRREGPRFRHRVVFSHIPLWPFAVGRQSEVLGDAELEAILREGGVDLHLSGHHHAYYPGFKDGVRYVSQGCLGAAPRPVLGTTEPGARSITVIDFDEDGAIRVEAYGGPAYLQRIARDDLPPRIESRWATIVRDDLARTAGGPPVTARPAAAAPAH
jgi:predicted MPP superfamily phosphohydrolase